MNLRLMSIVCFLSIVRKLYFKDFSFLLNWNIEYKNKKKLNCIEPGNNLKGLCNCYENIIFRISYDSWFQIKSYHYRKFKGKKMVLDERDEKKIIVLSQILRTNDNFKVKSG